jgi:hypothetical protein
LLRGLIIAIVFGVSLTAARYVSAQESEGDTNPEQGDSTHEALSETDPNASEPSTQSDPPEALDLPEKTSDTSADKQSENTVISEGNGSKQSSPGVQWFRHAGLGFRAGATFRETATSLDFPAAYALGPELYLAVWSYSIHRALIGAGYLYLDDSRKKGSEQISVSTEYHRVDLFAGYEIAWKMLTAGLRVGAALTIVRVETSYGQPTWEVIGIGEEAELVIYGPHDPEVRKDTGLSPGFLGGLGIGLAIGHYLFGIDDLIEIRAQADYVRRDERDEFAVYGLVVFWPTRLIR